MMYVHAAHHHVKDTPTTQETREEFRERLFITAMNAYDNRDYPAYAPALMNAATSVYDVALRDVLALPSTDTDYPTNEGTFRTVADDIRELAASLGISLEDTP